MQPTPITPVAADDPYRVVDNRAASRYEVWVGDAVAVAEYATEPGVITFTHTAVPPELEGRGIAAALARAALDDARAAGLRVRPRCPFFAAYIRRHAEYADLVQGGSSHPGGASAASAPCARAVREA